METRVEQEVDYEREIDDFRVIFEGDAGSVESYGTSDGILETEQSKEREVVAQRYVVEEGGFYPFNPDENEMSPPSPLELNEKQEQAVQVALSGGELAVEVLTPFGTDEIEVWSIQTFACGEPTPDGKPTFILSAISEERPRPLEQPEEDADTHDSNYENVLLQENEAGNNLPIASLPETPARDLSPAYPSSEGSDSYVSHYDAEVVSSQPLENIVAEEPLRDEPMTVLAPNMEVAMVTEVEQATPTTPIEADLPNESDLFEVPPVLALENEEVEVTSNIQSEPELVPVELEQAAIETQEEVILPELERPVIELEAADLSEAGAAFVELSVTLPQLEESSPMIFQPDDTIYLRQEKLAEIASDDTLHVTEEVKLEVAEPFLRVEPVLQEIKKVEYEHHNDQQRDLQLVTGEVAIEGREDVQLHEVVVTPQELAPTIIQLNKPERAKMARSETSERAAPPSKVAVAHSLEPSLWELGDNTAFNNFKASAPGIIVDEDDIVVSFESHRASRQIRKTRARSMAA